ncbi:MAG: hypothetical protein ACOC6C_02510 [Verrucomicrobiota bacterium]
MNLSKRELTLTLTTSAIALFGLTVIFAKPRFEEWQAIREQKSVISEDISEKKEMIAQKEKWENQFARLREALPSLPEDRRVDVHWLSIMDNIASQNDLTIGRREAGKEKHIRGVYELPIECKEWEGTIASLVNFLIDMRKQGAILDIRYLTVRRKDSRNLRGSFLLYAAYTRNREQEQEREADET